MNSFTYCVPTKIEFGKDCENLVAKNIKEFGGNKVFIVHGSDRVLKNGLMDKITKNLDDANIEYMVIGGVIANPLLSFAYDAIEKAKDFGADFILGVGGGSVIDTAKAVAHGVKNPDDDIWDFWSGVKLLTKSTPVGAILTIPAAGSESSNSSVLTNESIAQKRSYATELNRPKFALLNPEFTYTLPKYQIGCGIVDIIMHTLDRYFTANTVNQMTDLIGEAVVKNTMKNGLIAIKNPSDYTAMSELMWAGSLSHNNITGLGQLADFAPHNLAHELSAKFNLAHGGALSVVWGAWATHTYKTNPERFEQFGINVLGIDEGNAQKTALKTIEELKNFFRTLDMPTCLSEANIKIQTKEELKELANRCVYKGTRKVGNFVKLDENDCLAIYTLINK